MMGSSLAWPLAALTLLIYVQCFWCCYMIGFESATMVHYFTEGSVARHLLIAYSIGYTLIAFLQSDFLTMGFPTFRAMMVGMLVLLLAFYWKMPAKGGIRFVKKADGLVAPKRFLCGFLLLAFLGALLVISPHTAKDHTQNIYRKLNVHSRYELIAWVNSNKIEL